MSANEKRKSFLFYLDYKPHLSLLTSEEQGKLLMAMIEYVESSILPEFDGSLAMCFSFLKLQFDRDNQKYIERCEKNVENGKKGGRPRKTEKTERFSEKPKKPDIDKDIDKDKDKDIVYGEFENVLLDENQLNKLKNDFPQDWEKRIENLSSYMASTGKKYKDHYATIKTWSRKEKKNEQYSASASTNSKRKESDGNDRDPWKESRGLRLI